MRNPNGRQSEHVGKAIAGKRPAKVGKNGRMCSGRSLDRSCHALHPRVIGIEARGLHRFGARRCNLDRRKSVRIEMRSNGRHECRRGWAVRSGKSRSKTCTTAANTSIGCERSVSTKHALLRYGGTFIRDSSSSHAQGCATPISAGA